MKRCILTPKPRIRKVISTPFHLGRAVSSPLDLGPVHDSWRPGRRNGRNERDRRPGRGFLPRKGKSRGHPALVKFESRRL